jgi:hypothetical protein
MMTSTCPDTTLIFFPVKFLTPDYITLYNVREEISGFIGYFVRFSVLIDYPQLGSYNC